MPAKSNRKGKERQAKRYKVLRRVRVPVDRFQEFGVRLGDTAIIAMTGDVRPGELGYFSVDGGGHTYKQFKFLCEQDEKCKEWSTCAPGGVCLRTFKNNCWGTHEGAAYGRAVAVLRDGREVETTLNLRPYDEREGPATTRLEFRPPGGEETPRARAGQARGDARTKAAKEEPAARTRRELFANAKTWGAKADANNAKLYPLGFGTVTTEVLARYNIRKGDAVRFTLDGDAEHGELALVTYYDSDDERRYWFPAFLVVEGDHFCLREGSHLECEDDHHDADRLTIVGRLVRVERGGLTVKLKDLELRGLPYAEDLPPAKEEDDGED